MKVRNRIIARNCSIGILRTTAFLAMISIISFLYTGFFVLILGASLNLLILSMLFTLASILRYEVLWLRLIDQMKNSEKDQKFANKMLKQNTW